MKHLDSHTSNDLLGRQICNQLSGALDELPYEITERLRAARVQAVEKRKEVLHNTSPALFAHGSIGTLTAGHGGSRHSGWWQRLGAVGLLLALISALLTINLIQDELGARELADIDAAILTDDLPPAAYLDAGFTQFLKLSHRQEP